jgi:hypothetical protein
VNVRLNLLVALPAEAKAINRILGLQRLQPDGELPIYTAGGMALVLSGPGMTAASSGVDYLHRRTNDTDVHWLNIGIAGHGTLSLGQAMIASSVESPIDRRICTLRVPDQIDCPTSPLQTVLQHIDDYRDGVAYDMEAAGFVTRALNYSPPDKIHVLKIVSDNPQNPSRAINAKMVTRLILEQSAIIVQFIQRILRDDD